MFQAILDVQFIATIVKVLFAIVIALQVPPLMVWLERRQAAFIQKRIGPNRVGLFGFRLFGLGQPLADTIKLLFKEDFVPVHVNKFFYLAAPVISGTMALIAVTAIPFGDHVIVAGEVVRFQAISLNVGFLFLFAMSALGVYGVALAGWSSNNKYALLGGLRASAQMISYEIAMGVSLLPIVFIFQSIELQTIVSAQGGTLLGFLPNWGVFYAPVSFVIFIVAMFAETNRLPFDLAEGEAELVAGFLTEYGSMRWSLFFLGEYAMMFALSALCVSLFLGGYQLPYLSHADLVGLIERALSVSHEIGLWIGAVLGVGILIAKVTVFMVLFCQVRFTLPRFRYDQLMRIGWVYMLPVALINVVITAIIAGVIRFH